MTTINTTSNVYPSDAKATVPYGYRFHDVVYASALVEAGIAKRPGDPIVNILEACPGGIGFSRLEVITMLSE